MNASIFIIYMFFPHLKQVLGISADLGQPLPHVLGPAVREVVPQDGRLLWPVDLGGGAQQGEDGAQLVRLVPPGEQRLPADQLGQDAARAPDVDRGGVGHPQEYLWGSVPQCHHCGRQQGVEVVDSGETEIGQLDISVARDKDVLGLDVPVDNPVAVEEVDPAEYLPHYVFHFCRGQPWWGALLHKGGKILFHVLKHQVEDHLSVVPAHQSSTDICLSDQNLIYLGPWQMSRRRTMFGWLYLPRCLSKLISRSTFMGTPSSPSWIFTFFIATTVSVFRSRALYTVA